MPNQSRSEGTYLAGQVTVIDTDDVTPEVRALLADRDRWRKRAAAWKAAARDFKGADNISASAWSSPRRPTRGSNWLKRW